jgi:hypothetical protein
MQKRKFLNLPRLEKTFVWILWLYVTIPSATTDVGCLLTSVLLSQYPYILMTLCFPGGGYRSNYVSHTSSKTERNWGRKSEHYTHTWGVALCRLAYLVLGYVVHEEPRPPYDNAQSSLLFALYFRLFTFRSRKSFSSSFCIPVWLDCRLSLREVDVNCSGTGLTRYWTVWILLAKSVGDVFKYLSLRPFCTRGHHGRATTVARPCAPLRLHGLFYTERFVVAEASLVALPGMRWPEDAILWATRLVVPPCQSIVRCCVFHTVASSTATCSLFSSCRLYFKIVKWVRKTIAGLFSKITVRSVKYTFRRSIAQHWMYPKSSVFTTFS